jgi:hypothetical protein
MSSVTGWNRRQWLGGSAAFGAVALGLSVTRGATPVAPWRVGTARREITPPREVGILMSSGRRQWAPFDGVRMPLHARAVVVENSRARIGVVSLDLLGLAGTAVGGMDDFKRRVSAHAGRAVAADQFVLASTHTHSGPESIGLTDLAQTEPFRQWTEHLARQVGAALQAAAASLRPCRLLGGSIAAPGLSVNRRVLTSRGITAARLIRPTDKVLGPEGPTDDQLRVLSFEAEARQPAAILVQATAHPVYEMCIKQVSPDYAGEMANLLEGRHQGAAAMFLQGAAGNINSPEVSSGAADAGRHGRRLADLVDQSLAKFRPIPGDELMLRWRPIRLPARTPQGQAQAEPLLARIGAVRIGQAALVFLPGEPFVEIALAICAASTFALTAVVGYAEDYIGYIPTDRAFRNGGYETGPGLWSRVAIGSEAVMRQEAIELLKSLGGGR